MWASWSGRAYVVQLLLSAGADKDAASKVGYRGAGHSLDVRAAAFVARRCKRGTIFTRIVFYCSAA